MKKITVLGCGMVGRAIAVDLAKFYNVTSVDINKRNLDLLPFTANIETEEADLSNSQHITSVIANADLVIGAVPGFMGFEMLRTVISNRKNIVDISFFPEDPFLLDELAREQNVTAVVDCGVAPGMDNIILGYHNERMEVSQFICLVGGLPFRRTMPFQYKAPFSPIDVLEEYTRPARLVENGKVVVKPALSEIEEVEFEEIGTLESFNSDGLRSLVKTMEITNMKEKTLRYPGHAKLMEILRDMGFFSKGEIQAGEIRVSPLKVAAALLFPKWKYENHEKDFTVMRVVIEGIENGISKVYRYDLFDEYDIASQTSSMARTTGYTCTGAATMLLEGIYVKKGIIPPEYLGKDEKCYHFLLSYLKERGIIYRKHENFAAESRDSWIYS
ncbi:MAG: saccharopine dehydrogenase NADP-binding domain-containing protein [Chitinophagales bacterium]|nr:saccharopine dehydrogenase NADP-binding domain-containing protein [Chitinophagales bacterium]